VPKQLANQRVTTNIHNIWFDYMGFFPWTAS